MNTPHDPLDAMLRNDAAGLRDIYIDDAGFTQRLVAALPAPASNARHRSKAIRFGVPFAFTLVATVVVICCSAGGSLAVDALLDLATQTITANAVGFLLVIAVAIALSLSNLSGERSRTPTAGT